MRKIEYMDSFSIDDIGNFVLVGNDDYNNKSYLIIRTVLGVSRILQIGPIADGAVTQCSCMFKQTDYDDKKIDKFIDKFVSQNEEITQIRIFDIKTKEDL
jgi:hypothetical protein